VSKGGLQQESQDDLRFTSLQGLQLLQRLDGGMQHGFFLPQLLAWHGDGFVEQHDFILSGLHSSHISSWAVLWGFEKEQLS